MWFVVTPISHGKICDRERTCDDNSARWLLLKIEILSITVAMSTARSLALIDVSVLLDPATGRVKAQKVTEYFRGINTSGNAHEHLRQAVLLFCCPMDSRIDKYLHKQCILRHVCLWQLLCRATIICYAIQFRRRHEVQGQDEQKRKRITNWKYLL